jgi:hypothetical protein
MPIEWCRKALPMDKLTEYPKLIKDILTEYVELCNRHPNPGIETFLIVDEAKAHYIWMNLGWQNSDRVTGMTVYVRIRDNKFWIEEDWTEDGIATDLIRAGVPKEDIVLAFHEPRMRQYTEFAVCDAG